MSQVTTHVLDTARGRPAEGVRVELHGPDGVLLDHAVTGHDGRIGELGPEALPAGDYRLVFDTGAWFEASGQATFFPRVTLDVTLADEGAHYHVPLLLSPFGFSTYRGS